MRTKNEIWWKYIDRYDYFFQLQSPTFAKSVRGIILEGFFDVILLRRRIFFHQFSFWFAYFCIQTWSDYLPPIDQAKYT